MTVHSAIGLLYEYLAQAQHSANRQLENIYFPMEKLLHHPNMDGTVTVRCSTFVHRGSHRRRAPFPLSAVREVAMGRLRSYGDFKTFFFISLFFFLFSLFHSRPEGTGLPDPARKRRSAKAIPFKY